MLFTTIYRWRADSHTKAAVSEILERYGALGEGPGLVAHYLFTDGTGGIIVTEGQDAEYGYRVALALREFTESTELHGVLPIEEALPLVIDYAAG
jgi:hypothetical protein